MELATREDIDAPIDWVFGQVTDHAAFERIALRRGAEVERRDPGQGFEPGAAWRMVFPYRGRERVLDARVTGVDRPNGWTATLSVGGIDGTVKVDLVAMSRSRTRMIVEVALAAQSLSARLLLQSVKLARGNVLKRFRNRVAGFAAELENRHRGGA